MNVSKAYLHACQTTNTRGLSTIVYFGHTTIEQMSAVLAMYIPMAATVTAMLLTSNSKRSMARQYVCIELHSGPTHLPPCLIDSVCASAVRNIYSIRCPLSGSAQIASPWDPPL